MLIDCKSMPFEELRAALTERGIPAFRAAQIRGWLDNGAVSFDEMRNLPRTLRTELSDFFCIPTVKIEKKLVSDRDNTVKYLYGLSDGENVESVLMQYRHGWSQCLSTQVGCRMGCSFCATGMGGFVRNLLPSEIMAQIEAAQADTGVRVSSVVLMGMGEPLDNFDNVLRFLAMLSEPGGVHIGMRPVNRRWPMAELLKACRDYSEKTGRRISYEYAMVDGVNDTDACAEELGRKLRGTLCHVNLIPVNEVPGKDQRRSSVKRLHAFSAILERYGVTVTVRRTLGSDINASCGQLRRQTAEASPDGNGVG